MGLTNPFFYVIIYIRKEREHMKNLLKRIIYNDMGLIKIIGTPMLKKQIKMLERGKK